MKAFITGLTSLLVSTILLFSSCGEEPEPPIPLKANAGEDQTATLNSTVTLNGSQSTGPVGFTYAWLLSNSSTGVLENEINFQGANTASASFVPPRNGVYTFILRVLQAGLINEDQVTVTVTGMLTLPATISSPLMLVDVEPDPSKPDYQASGLVTVQAGLSLERPGIVIEFNETGGLILESGSVNLTGADLTSANGWKGILIKGANVTLEANTKLQKAGKSTFSGQTETASITLTSGSLKLQITTFVASVGTYDLLVTGGTLEDVFANTFSTAKPIKAAIQYVSKLKNVMPANYDHIVLTTPGAGTIQTSPDGFTFSNNTTYLIDGDFTAGSNVTVQGGAHILMKAGSGFMQSAQTFSSSSGSSPAVFEGEGESAWKGIAIGASSTGNFSNLHVRGAGSAVFNTGSFTSETKAAIYIASFNNGSMNGTVITDSDGYGIYIAPGAAYTNIQNTTITNSVKAAIAADISQVHLVVSNTTNEFNMLSGVAAFEVRSTNPSTFQPIGIWQSLGGTNFYMITGHVKHVNSVWTLAAGTRLKFQAGKSLLLQGGPFTAIGTANEPIVFDSEAGTQGTWAGILVECLYKFEHCQINNGGDSYLYSNGVTPTSEKANITFNYTGSIANASFVSNTISGSGGYGVVVEAGAINPNADVGTTFTNNVSGNVIIK